MPIHFGPTVIIVYADGYTVGHDIACAAPIRIDEIQSTRSPYEVDCRGCRESAPFIEALALYEQTGIPPVPEAQYVPRMASSVFRSRGVYNIAENNRVREKLGMEAVFPCPWTIAWLMGIERRIRAECRRARHETEMLEQECRRLGLDPAGLVKVTSTDARRGQSETSFVWTDRFGAVGEGNLAAEKGTRPRSAD